MGGGCPRQQGGNESTCERRRARKANYPGMFGDLTLGRPVSARAAPAGANLREKLSRWNASLTRPRKLKRIVAHRAPSVGSLSPRLSHWQTSRIRGRMNKFSPAISSRGTICLWIRESRN